MTRTRLIQFAAAGSAALLAAAFIFQALGWAPCKMCLWQRWPHAGAVLLGMISLWIGPKRALAILGALATFNTAAIAAFHSGVERKWWDGPASCSGSGNALSALQADQLVPGAGDVPILIMCDSFTPFLAGLSMANWNLVASLGLTAVWVLAATQPKTNHP
ncbi:MAG: disulfide bond formation protein B [Paracoccaceae bacterium]